MGDLTSKNASQTVSLVGADKNGAETNYINASSDGALLSDINTFPLNSMDAFGNLITTERNIIFSSSFANSTFDGLLWNSKTAGSGTVSLDSTKSSLELKTTTTSGDEATTQTNRTMYYVPGQGMVLLQTLTPATPKSNLIQEWGLRTLVATNEFEGMWFRYSGTTLQVVKSSKISGSLVETAVNQADWNYDKMDGTGPSGLTLDFTKGLIYTLEYQWLGYGNITFGVFYNTKVYPVHVIQHFGTLSAPYTKSHSFKSFFSCRNTGTTSATSYMYPECTCVIAYGKSYLGQNTQHVGTEANTVSINASSYTPVLGLKLRDTSTTTCELLLSNLDLFVTSNIDVHFIIVYNPTVTGGSWVNRGYISAYNISVTSYSGGTVVAGGYLNKTKFIELGEIMQFLRFGHLINGNGIPILIAAKTLSSNGSIAASAILKELL